jgi:hypothetical protein
MGRRRKQAELGSEASAIAAKIMSERPPVDGEHYLIFRWPGPGLYRKPLNGVVLRHCYPTKRVSLSERCMLSALKAGFEYLSWAVP